MRFVPQARVSLQAQFDSKVLNDDRTPSERFVISEEFVATLDYLVAASLWASITDTRGQAQYYIQRVNYRR